MAKRLLTLIIVISLIFAVGAATALAQQNVRESDAIATAAQSAPFTDGLAQYPGWTAAAYDTGNAYGIWRVQFWSAAGDDLGWADVNPVRDHVYSWETHFGATDAQKTAAEPVLRKYVEHLPDLVDLLQDPAQYPIYIDYDGWNRWWGIYIDRGENSIWMAVQFDGKVPSALENPRLIGMYFSNVLSYDDWQQSQQAIAIATAFKNPEIAKAVNRVDDWTTSVEHNDDQRWTVSFVSGEDLLAQVQVDLATNEVIDYSVSG